jgi:hypothetical protein
MDDAPQRPLEMIWPISYKQNRYEVGRSFFEGDTKLARVLIKSRKASIWQENKNGVSLGMLWLGSHGLAPRLKKFIDESDKEDINKAYAGKIRKEHPWCMNLCFALNNNEEKGVDFLLKTKQHKWSEIIKKSDVGNYIKYPEWTSWRMDGRDKISFKNKIESLWVQIIKEKNITILENDTPLWWHVALYPEDIRERVFGLLKNSGLEMSLVSGGGKDILDFFEEDNEYKKTNACNAAKKSNSLWVELDNFTDIMILSRKVVNKNNLGEVWTDWWSKKIIENKLGVDMTKKRKKASI